jgi:translation initiation factor IF-2
MPNFENLEKYETTDPKSQERRMVPIAPHSMQAIDYRPMRQAAARPKPAPKPAFKPVAFEPVSVEQMEREFRQAGRSSGGPSPLARLAKAVQKWIGKLKEALRRKTGLKKRKHPRNGQREQHRNPHKGGQQGHQKGYKNGSQSGPNKGPQAGRPGQEPRSHGEGEGRRRRRNRKSNSGQQNAAQTAKGPSGEQPGQHRPSGNEGRPGGNEGRPGEGQRRSNRSKRRRSGRRDDQPRSGNGDQA